MATDWIRDGYVIYPGFLRFVFLSVKICNKLFVLTVVLILIPGNLIPNVLKSPLNLWWSCMPLMGCPMISFTGPPFMHLPCVHVQGHLWQCLLKELGKYRHIINVLRLTKIILRHFLFSKFYCWNICQTVFYFDKGYCVTIKWW